MSETTKDTRDLPPPEQLSLNEERYNEVAKKLFEEHRNKILAVSNVRPTAINKALKQFSDEILSHYWGHGVTRGQIEQQIAAAVSILENNVIFGDAAPIKSGHINAYTDGNFLVISRKGGTNLIKGWDKRMPEFIQTKGNDGRPKKGMRIEPGAFVCNGKVDSLVEPLRKMFPGIKILHAEELGDYIEEEAKR